MTEKNIPVHAMIEGKKVQIGLAAPRKNGVQPLEIWDQFLGVKLDEVLIEERSVPTFQNRRARQDRRN